MMQINFWLLVSNNKKEIFSIIAFIIIIILLKTSHTTKINIGEIIKLHISTLKLYGRDKIDFGDIQLFFLTPLFVAGLLSVYIELDDTKLGIIVTAFTIFVGLLFNILAILLAFNENKEKYLERKFIKEILYNVSFSVIVSITVIILSILRLADFNDFFIKILDYILFYMINVFLLCLFMILKRLFNLLLDKMSDDA